MSGQTILDLTNIINPSLTGVTVVVDSGVTYNTSLESIKQSIVDGVSHYFTGSQNIDTVLNIGTGQTNQIYTTGKLNVYGETEPYNYLITAIGENNSYVGMVVENRSTDVVASSDFVANASEATDLYGYVNMGINSINYSGTTGFTALGGPGDAYIFGAGNDLYIGNASPDKEVVIFNGGFDTKQTSKIRLHSQGTITINGETYDTVNPEILRINNTFGTSYNLITAFNDVDNYSQINIRNSNTGQTASSDFVATADNGTEDGNYINLGINNSNYTNTGDTIGKSNDGYLYSTGNDLYIGNASPNKKLVFFNGGSDTEANSVFYIHEEGAITINTSETDPSNPSALRVVDPTGGYNSLFHGDSSADSFAAISIQNISEQINASADFVAYNDTSESNINIGYINMGINSSNYDKVGEIGGPNDAYLYSTGNDLYIGNATTGTDSNIKFLTNGISDDNISLILTYDRKLGLNNPIPEFNLDVSGSTRLVGPTYVQSQLENVTSLTGSTSVVNHDLSISNVFYHFDISDNFTVNVVNIPFLFDRIVNLKLVIQDNQNPVREPLDFQIEGVSYPVLSQKSNFDNTIPDYMIEYRMMYVNYTWKIYAKYESFS